MVGDKSPKQGKHSRTVTSIQFVSIILITVGLSIVLDLGHRAAVNAGLERESQQLAWEVATLEAEQADLTARQQQVQTDEYVAEWARTEGRMVQVGETPVVPLPAQGPPPAADSSSGQSLAEEPVSFVVEPAATSHWQEWWQFFFASDVEPVDQPSGR
ncbi:MAG: FtsB family cell division protein [Chloroflexota bacterium]